MRTFAPHLKITEVYNQCFSGCSAVGSVPGLGPGCRRFESCHPDENPSVHKTDGFFVFVIKETDLSYVSERKGLRPWVESKLTVNETSKLNSVN